MAKNKISFIGTTQGGRLQLLERLFESLLPFKDDVQIIFVDQDKTNNSEKIFQKYVNIFDLRVIFSEPVSLSKARNQAIKFANGNIITFCDDDAFYDQHTLDYVLNNHNKNYVLISKLIDKTTSSTYGGRSYPTKDKKMSYLDITRYALSVGSFIYLDNSINKILEFDESFGVGTPYGGSEETLFYFILKSEGFDFYFNKSLICFHDNDIVSSNVDVIKLAKKYESYAVGYILVCKSFIIKSNFTLLLEILNIFIRTFLGIIISKNKTLYFYRFKGLLKGLFLTRTK